MREIREYAVIKDGKILRTFQTADGIEGVHKSIERKKLAYDIIEEIPLDNECHTGNDLRKFRPDWKQRSLQDQLNDGLINIPDTMTIRDNRIIKKMLKELIDTGVRKLQEWEYYEPETDSIKVDESKVPKPPEPTKEELLTELNNLIERAKEIESNLQGKTP